MFTGIIEEIGKITGVKRRGRNREVTLACRVVLGDLKRGHSVAVEGVCLTAEKVTGTGFSATLSPETLGRTTLKGARAGTPVNLERPIQAGGRFGGHFVQGHVDGVGRMAVRKLNGRSRWVTFEFPREFQPFLVEKGSVAVDGVSLTVAEIRGLRFSVALIPETLKRTTLGFKNIGDPVNIETDMVAKYTVGAVRESPLGPSKLHFLHA